MKYLLTLGIFFTPAYVMAATILLTPTTLTLAPGESFSVAIRIKPDTHALYTTSPHFSFDPKLLQETQFTLAPGWLALSQTGYDEVGNEKGVFIKTAGYPGGFTHETLFGSVTFKTLADGTTTLAVTNDSVLLDASSTNRLSGSQGAVGILSQQGSSPSTLSSILVSETPAGEEIRQETRMPENRTDATLAQAASVLPTPALAAVVAAEVFPWSHLSFFVIPLALFAFLWIRFRKRVD